MGESYFSAANSHRRVDDEFQGGVIVGLEGRVFEAQLAHCRMHQVFLASCAAADVVRVPPPRELRAALSQAIEKLAKRRVTGPQVMRRSELGHHAFCLLSPGWPEQKARRLAGQHEQQDIAVPFGETAEGKDLIRGGIPDKDIPPAASNVGGLV